jgi:hypothetical protein
MVVSAPGGPGSFSSLSLTSPQSPGMQQPPLQHSQQPLLSAPLEAIHRLRQFIDVLFFFETLEDRQHDEQRAKFASVLAEASKAEAKSSGASALPMPLAGEGGGGESKEGKHDDGSGDPKAGSDPAPALQPQRTRAEFRASVRKWLQVLVDALFRMGSLSDHRYVFSQLVRSRGAAEWASFVQFSRVFGVEAARAALGQQQQQQGHGQGHQSSSQQHQGASLKYGELQVQKEAFFFVR